MNQYEEREREVCRRCKSRSRRSQSIIMNYEDAENEDKEPEVNKYEANRRKNVMLCV